MKRIEILMLNYEYPPLGGGAANTTAYLLAELRSRADIGVDLLTSSTGEQRIEELSDRIRIHFLDIGKKGNLHYQTNRDLLVYSWRAYFYAGHLMKEKRYDLCHSFFGVPCGFVAQRLGLPYLIFLQGSDVPFYNERFKWLDRLIFKWLSPHIWRRASSVIANSSGFRDLALKSAPDQRIDVIPNGIDTDFFVVSASRPPAPSASPLRVLCVSRLIARKRIDILLRAVAELPAGSVSLTIAGTGNEEQNLRDLATSLGIAQTVVFKGYVSHDSIVSIYQDADVFAMPSVNEGMSNTVLEAMACGLPIIMTQTGGAEELLFDGQNGFLLEKNSTADLVDKLRRYLENRDIAAQHGAYSRRIAESMSWRCLADAYLEQYERALKIKS